MANYFQCAAVARNENFQRRVAYALTKAAITVYGESGLIVGHAARALYATKILTGQYNLDAVVRGALSDSTIAAEADTSEPNNNGIADSHIDTALAAMFNVLAGA